jgi:hypothetical protein
MKINLLFLFTVLFSSAVHSQDFRGQWKGDFVDKSASMQNWGEDRCEYVLELETSGNRVTGHSFTYFTEGNKKYYTICKLEGFIDRKRRYVEVKETERTKTNVPTNIRNCFQTHKLTYYKQGEIELLEGNWIPAPKQEGDCGYGYTSLERRTLKSMPGSYSKMAKVQPKKQIVPHNKPNPPVAKQSIKPKTETKPKSNDIPVTVQVPSIDVPKEKKILPLPDFKKRNINVLKTIKVDTEMIRVDLYDNGEIDGDSVTLYYNGRLLVSNKKLSDRALSFSLEVDKAAEINELVMYAENLGSIPPNTALMVVTDGKKRYEVRITSDLQKSGVIHFIHQSNALAE